MKIYQNRHFIPYNFSGVCKVLVDGSIRHYQNGLYHREDGPAIISENGDTSFFIQGLRHREDGPAFEGVNGAKMWCYRNVLYGKSTSFNSKTWIKFVQQLKYQESLNIFK